ALGQKDMDGQGIKSVVRVHMAGTQDFRSDLQRLSKHGLRLGEFALVLEHPAQVEKCVTQVGMRLAKNPPAHFQSRTMDALGFGELSLPPQRESEPIPCGCYVGLIIAP